MQRKSIVLAALAIGVLAFASNGAIGQETTGKVKEGHTTIEFQSAATNQAGMDPIKAWSAFAAEHPKIARALGNKPALIKDAGYLKKHPELDAFFSAHPDIRDAMAENPGNFVAPSSASSE
jgi:ABC-type glycerol-3-phosphate transport system substrate-binding protein